MPPLPKSARLLREAMRALGHAERRKNPGSAQDPAQIEATIAGLLQKIPQTMTRDGYHATIAFLFQPAGLEILVVDMDPDRMEKSFRDLRARGRTARAAVLASEGWRRDPSTGQVVGEVLTASIERAWSPGLEVVLWPITRDGRGAPRLGAMVRSTQATGRTILPSSVN